MTSCSLAEKNCIPCRGDVPPLPLDEKTRLRQQLHADWRLEDEGKRLCRTFKLKEFQAPMALAAKIAQIADKEWHHPELVVNFGRLEVRLWTHKIDDLVESDFILAAKIDHL